MVPRANERARSKAEGRTQHVQKPDISKRPSVIGTTKSNESTSPTIPGKPKARKPSSKASDTFPEPLSIDSSNFLVSQHLMKTPKITSPLNTPSVRDQMSNYSSVVPTHFPFQHPVAKPDVASIGLAVSNGIPNSVLPKSNATVTHAQSSKENRKSPPTTTATTTTAKKPDKTEEKLKEAVSSTKALSSSTESKSSNKNNGNIAKKRKNNKSSSADEDGKKKQKTNSNHEKKTSYSVSAVGKGKVPILPPSPFISKSSSTSNIREM